jgi:hypothetical protein
MKIVATRRNKNAPSTVLNANALRPRPMKHPLLLCLACAGSAAAVSIDDLWITEVRPSTGEVEVTNVGDGPLTTTSALPFCHRKSYGNGIPTGTFFPRGQAIVFTLTLSDSSDSDLWLYRGGSFDSAANINTGLKWGPDTNVGRTGIASAAGKWGGPNLPSPTAEQSLHLTGTDPFQSSSWTLGPPDLGNHAFPFGSASVSLTTDMTNLSWDGGSPPFRIESSTNLFDWTFLTGLIEERTQSVARDSGEPKRFYRVQNQATLEESAQFRITFISLWSTSSFASVPGTAHFSGLVGGMHNDLVSFWSPGNNASPGIESMAETGSKLALLVEVQAALSDGNAQQTFDGSGLGGAGSQTTLDFTAQRSHPLLTITSMIAPSPDWFVGLHDQSLLMGNDNWVNSLTFELVSYDAGTDSGTVFSASNVDTVPQQEILLIPASDSNFAPASGPVGAPIPIARIVITRLP